MVAGGQVYNVSERRTPSMALWARQILDAAGASDTELVPVPSAEVPEDLHLTRAHPQHLLVDSAKLRAALGWTESDPDAAVARSVAWHLAHPPDPAADSDASFAADDQALAAVSV
jgi:nucleoside-diphosphate-sugar epimerase